PAVTAPPGKPGFRSRRPQAGPPLIVSALRSRLAAALGPAAAAGIPPASGVAERPPAYGTRPSPGAVRLVPMESPEAPAAASPEQATLWHPAPEGFAGLRFVGQVLNGYLLCEGNERVVLIDQHAAHARVRFERLRAEHANGAVARDALLVPEAVALPPVQVAALAEHEHTLAAAGLEGEPFGDGTFLFRTVPRLLRGHDVGALLRAVASELGQNGASMAAGRAADAVLATLACHSAVRVGQRLGAEQVRALLESMDTIDINAHCPH